MKDRMDVKTLEEVPPWEWPANAAKIFHRTLVDQQASESDRLIAARLAGDLVVMNDQLAETLLAIVRSGEESEALRSRAAISLGAVLEQADLDVFEEPDVVPITEGMFHGIVGSLHKLYLDSGFPKMVRRKILEASVRASQDWHPDAIREAYASGDREWMLTAVFCMRWVRGFDEQILDALNSPDEEIHYEAVQAAGNWALDRAWSHVVSLVEDPQTPKFLRLAAIDAAASIRPCEAGAVLVELTDSEDQEIAEAADEAMDMAQAASDESDDEDDEGELVQ